MRHIVFYNDFDVDDVSLKLNNVMSRWSSAFLDMDGSVWRVYDYDGNVRLEIMFDVDFNDLEIRIRLEDLKLNVIHHIESLRDETSYRDNLIEAYF